MRLFIIVFCSIFCLSVSQSMAENQKPLVDKHGNSRQNGPYQDDVISDEDMKRIDAAPDAPIDPKKIILPNGKSLEEYNRERGIKAK